MVGYLHGVSCVRYRSLPGQDIVISVMPVYQSGTTIVFGMSFDTVRVLILHVLAQPNLAEACEN